jgi:hypothetical protein
MDLNVNTCFNSDYSTTLAVAQPIASNDRVLDECSIRRDVDGSKCGLFENTILALGWSN